MDERVPVVFGSGIRIRGTVRGAEDIVLEGRLDGAVELPDHHLMVEVTARVEGDVDARDVTIRGELAGDVTASDRIQLDPSAQIVGDIAAPRLVVEDGARFSGNVVMEFALPPGVGRERQR